MKRRWIIGGCLWLLTQLLPASGQFLDEFIPGHDEPASLNPWRVFSGDGEATITYTRENGFARIRVDATEDRNNIWWAVFQNNVEDSLNLADLEQAGYELRLEARIRSSHAPRRVNLSFSTQRTTDYHTNLMEFDIPQPNTWKEISLTTRGMNAKLGDRITAQLAMMDWGQEVFTVDVDYMKVSIVDPTRVGPDLGPPVPYHPPTPSREEFLHQLPPKAATSLDSLFPNMPFSDWTLGGETRSLSTGGSRFIVLRWDFSSLANRVVQGAGVLQLTTLDMKRNANPPKDLGQIRVVEILRGPRTWDPTTLTYNSLMKGQSWDQVLNPQMIIDQPVSQNQGSPNRWVISNPALQRLVSGESLGLAILPLGPIEANFYSDSYQEREYIPILEFNTEAVEK